MPIPNIGEILTRTKQVGGNAAEMAVIKAYLVKHIDDFDRVEFEVRLGPGMTVPADYPEYMQRYARANFRLRADLICWRGNIPTIVEAKDRLDGCAIGQLLTYTKLLKQDNPTLMQTYKTAIGLSILDGISDVFYDNGVLVELFPGADQLYGT